MLYVLTGDIQTGKTRWLQETIAALEASGVSPYGVIAPGEWVEHWENGTVTYEKTGICNELLPQHDVIPFARRANDLGDVEEQTTCSQAHKAKLSWAIDDAALARVNEHLAWVAGVTETEPANADASSKGILVIDELGRLELLHGGGLTNALALVERGATPALPHALIVVREQLLDQAKERFANAPWGGMTPVFPVSETRDELLAHCV